MSSGTKVLSLPLTTFSLPLLKCWSILAHLLRQELQRGPPRKVRDPPMWSKWSSRWQLLAPLYSVVLPSFFLADEHRFLQREKEQLCQCFLTLPAIKIQPSRNSVKGNANYLLYLHLHLFECPQQQHNGTRDFYQIRHEEALERNTLR